MPIVVTMAANIASIILMAPRNRSEMREARGEKNYLVSHLASRISLLILALALLILAIPQMVSGWLTAPANLDHVHTAILTPERATQFESAMKILPQADTAQKLTFAYLHAGPLRTQQRAIIQNAALRAVQLSPGDPYNWFYFAATLESEIFDPARRVLFDQALTMSMMTGPHDPNLVLQRAAMVAKHWNQLSQPLRDDWEDQIIALWADAPQRLRTLYLTMPPEGQKLVFATLDEIPGESIKFNQYLDHPDQPPAEPADDDNNATDVNNP